MYEKIGGRHMHFLFHGILQHRKFVIILFFILAVVGLILMLGVPVNYNMVIICRKRPSLLRHLTS